MSKTTLTPLSVSQAVRRALTVYRDGDAHLDATMKHHKITPACTGTCYGCCKQIVAMHLFEGIVLAQHLRENRTPEELEAITQRSEESYAQWLAVDMDRDRFFRLNRKCALLDENNRCMGYEARPISCRGYAVVSEPYKCEPDWHDIVSVIGHQQFDAQWILTVAAQFPMLHDLRQTMLPLQKALACGMALLKGGEPALRAELATFQKGGVFR